MFVFGTRPEAIKVAPLIRYVGESNNYSPVILLTGQHPTMAKEVLEWFNIVPDFEYQVDRTDGSLNGLVSQLIVSVGDGLLKVQPDLVIVQGDTASAYAGAVASFNLQIPVAHLEAGLRTSDIDSPFPEEAYRQMISRISCLNMCPTSSNKENLLREGISEETIMITGNTVVDAFAVVQQKLQSHEIEPDIPDNLPEHNLVLVTTHRRENLEYGMAEIGAAIANLSAAYPDLNFVIPMHPNPSVRSKIVPLLKDKQNVFLIEPLGYPEFITILSKSKFVLTDSGGVQEEAPILGIPALVMRENTERPEGIVSGGVRLVGASKIQIVHLVRELMSQDELLKAMSQASNPYGDGNAAQRCVSMIDEFFGYGVRSTEFVYVD
jgi:UDP-N-acetylglucosamine 2-epimerase (non-hydrolysing)